MEKILENKGHSFQRSSSSMSNNSVGYTALQDSESILSECSKNGESAAKRQKMSHKSIW